MHFPTSTSPSTTTTPRASISAPSYQTISSNTSTSSHKSSLVSALKKPFQGWSKELLAAKDNLDDEYNFADGSRWGPAHAYNFPNVGRRGC